MPRVWENEGCNIAQWHSRIRLQDLYRGRVHVAGPSSWLWTRTHSHYRLEVAKAHSMQRKVMLMGITLPELQLRLHSPNLLVKKFLPPLGSQSTLGSSLLIQPTSTIPSQPLYLSHFCIVYFHCIYLIMIYTTCIYKQTCIKNLPCVKASKGLQSNYTFKGVFMNTLLWWYKLIVFSGLWLFPIP